MKQLTFREVIANIKEGEIWEATKDIYNIKKISMLYNDLRIESNNNTKITCIDNNVKFKRQRKQYTFEEAFKYLEEGSQIENMECQKYHLDAEGNLIYTFYIDGEEHFKIFEAKDVIFSLDEIRGKWYINN